MKYWKSLLIIETVFYVLAAYSLEYFIAFPFMAFHHGKDGGLTSEISFLLLITFISCLFWYRKKTAYFVGTLLLAPISGILSYFFSVLLKLDGLGFLLFYLVLLTISKWFILLQYKRRQS
jgi:hypothetical protein